MDSFDQKMLLVESPAVLLTRQVVCPKIFACHTRMLCRKVVCEVDLCKWSILLLCLSGQFNKGQVTRLIFLSGKFPQI